MGPDLLEPLLTRFAQFVVMTRPIEEFGCASACSGVTAASSARERPRNGPPLAVTTSRRTSSARPPRRHWAMAECSLSTGTICPAAASALTSGPPMMSDSLLARAKVVPARSAASVGSSPIAPVMPLTTTRPHEPREPSRPGAVNSSGRYAVRPAFRPRGDASARSASEPPLPRRRDAQRDRLLGDEPEVAAGGEPDHLEAVGISLHEIDGLGAIEPWSRAG